MSKVLAVAHYYPPHVGGLEVVAREMAEGLHRRGHEVSVLTSALGGTPPGTLDENGVHAHRVAAWNGFERRLAVPFPVFSPSVLASAWRLVGRADVVHIHDMLYLSSWVTAIACWLRRRPYVVSAHVGLVAHDKWIVEMVQRVVHRSIGAAILSRATRVLPISEQIRSQLQAVNPEARFEVLPNGVDTQRYRPADFAEVAAIRSRFGLPLDEKLVLFVGRPVPKKGFDVVVAAGDDSYRLVFVGFDRPADCPGDDRHLYLGPQPVEATAAIYRCVDAFVCASVGEAPMTVLEAMCSGVPVVLNDDPALRGLGVGGAGVIFVPMTTPEPLVVEVRTLAQRPDLDDVGAQARAEALTFHSRDAQAGRLDEVLGEARLSVGQLRR